VNKVGRILAWIFGPLFLLLLLLRLFFFEPWKIPNDDKHKWLAVSIAPTLAGGDTVLLLTRGSPGFGDLVRCTDPENANDFVVGRIVGMPGDTVEIAGARLHVNGNNYNGSDACEEKTYPVVHPETGNKIDLACGRVEMGGGWYMMGQLNKASSESKRKVTISAGRAWLLSDNRSLHEDSRDFGQVALDTCKRRPVLRLWSAKGWFDSKRRFSAVR
jgi:signal peptidase I